MIKKTTDNDDDDNDNNDDGDDDDVDNDNDKDDDDDNEDDVDKDDAWKRRLRFNRGCWMVVCRSRCLLHLILMQGFLTNIIVKSMCFVVCICTDF